jgi:hypothetical protein
LATENNSISSESTAGLKYQHPHVTSTISANELTYTSTTGVLRKFVAYTSDKGVDNVIQRYTTKDEFIFHNGKPNMKKHGQAAYNITNWLDSGAEVYGLRVMPENAGFAHAFLNILAKKETKKIKDKDGDLVSVNNVTLKPAIAYTDVNNATRSLLNYELIKNRSANQTIDGFENHLLFGIYPKGRGKSYNDLGFRITLNESFDNMYDFRVYNFEVIRYDQYGTANAIEGPYYVSLSPEALGNSNESMFIEDVVNKYSQYVDCIFNERAFLELCETINPDVSPAHIDPLTGITKVTGDTLETFFSSVTQKFEDVHFSLHRYDSAGNVITDAAGQPILNIVDATDIIEQSILMADNAYRQKMYSRYQDGIDYMKTVFNSISANNYNKIIQELLYTPDGKTPESGLIVDLTGKLNGYHTTIKNLVEIFNASKLDSDFNNIVSENLLVEQGINQMIKLVSQLVSYHKALETNSAALNIEEQLNATVNKLNLKEIIDIKAVSKKDKINELSDQILTLKAGANVSDQSEALVSILSDCKDVIDYLLLIINENGLSATEINVMVDTYNVVIDLYNALFDPYLNSDQTTALVGDIYSRLDEMVASLYSIVELAIANIDLIIIDDIVSDKIPNLLADLVPLTYVNTALYAEKLSTPEGKEELVSNIRKNIDNSNAILLSMRDIVYTNQLQEFNSPVQFMNGSDGDLDDSNASLKISTTNQLLVQAFKGLIDSDISNRSVTPFRFILDANYSTDVKNAIVTLVRDIRKDVFYYADTGLKATAEDTLAFRQSEFNVSSQFVGIYSQDLVVYDEYTGKDIRVTPTYFLASKIPANAAQYGLQYPIAGNRRGTLDGYKSINYVPNEAYKETFYNKQLNYIESDPRRTRFGSQLTSDIKNTALSNINNVHTVLDIKVNVEDMSEDYQFEFEDEDTMQTFEYDLNDFLQTYVTSKKVEEITGTVYASDYDKQQKILRVGIEVKFKGIIERIVINIDVVQ